MAMVKGIDVATPAANAEMSKKIETSSESRDLGSEDNSESLVREDFDEISRARTIRNKYATLRYLGKIEQRLEELAGVETQGIDRIPDDKRRPPSLANAFFMWFSFNGSIASLPIGVLGPEFGLSLQLSVAAIIIGVFLGTFLSAYCALLGPKVGSSAILPGTATRLIRYRAAGSSSYRYVSILIRILGCQTLCHHQYLDQRRFCRGKFRRCRSASLSRIRLQDDNRCWLCDHRPDHLSRLPLWVRCYPYV